MLVEKIANRVAAFKNCCKQLEIEESEHWLDMQAAHEDEIGQLVKEFMPSGSGFDCGTKLDLDRSQVNKLIFETEFHHMNGNGYYDGWTQHTVTVTPTFGGFDIKVSGRNRNDIKDYIAETFDCALSQDN